jgi:hypothetical protein
MMISGRDRNVVIVNSGHRDFVFATRNRVLQLRYLIRLYVKELIRQGRDLPAILQKWSAPIRRELLEIKAKIERGEISWPARSAAKPRRKK